MEGNQTAAHIALLAPVPLIHLKSAIETKTPGEEKAFSSSAWKLFNKLDEQRKGMPVDVYIYESHPDNLFVGRATWHARYICLVSDRYEAQAYRPKSTISDTFKGEVYWKVERLHQMKPSEHISVADFVGFGKTKRYGKSFPPHRPLLVEPPL